MSENDQLKRLPSNHHHSLKAWNAADELMIKEMGNNHSSTAIYNDAFGYLSCQLADYKPFVITDLKSQREAIQLNLEGLDKVIDESHFSVLTDALPNLVDIVLLKIPKALDLFELYLKHIHQNISDNGTVYCGFMTKYFNAGMLKVAQKYFETLTQSKAEKKARVLILSSKKEIELSENTESFIYQNQDIKQYKGVFSGGKIDTATDYLIKHLNIPTDAKTVLDLACGNGIIGRCILEKDNTKEVHFLDDSHLAMESAKLNLASTEAIFHHTYHLNYFEDQSLDWIVSNPPFHFEHTIDIEIPLQLFRESHAKLSENGMLTIVANSNLGYESNLRKLFKDVTILASSSQFKIYECRK